MEFQFPLQFNQLFGKLKSVNKNKIMGLYWFSDEKKRGLYHWDSSLYPHGNLISKGKWAAEYKEEFKELHQTYNIDINLRGTT